MTNKYTVNVATLFAKLDQFDSQSSDDINRTDEFRKYHQAQKSLNWLFEIAWHAGETWISLALYEGVFTANPEKSGRSGGVIGIQVRISGQYKTNLSQFPGRFAGAFGNLCRSHQFFFDSDGSGYFPKGFNFPRNEAAKATDWATKLLDALLIVQNPVTQP